MAVGLVVGGWEWCGLQGVAHGGGGLVGVRVRVKVIERFGGWSCGDLCLVGGFVFCSIDVILNLLLFYFLTCM